MISVGEASARILRKIHPLDAETVPLERAAGRVLAETRRGKHHFAAVGQLVHGWLRGAEL